MAGQGAARCTRLPSGAQPIPSPRITKGYWTASRYALSTSQPSKPTVSASNNTAPSLAPVSSKSWTTDELFAMVRDLGFLNVHPLQLNVGITAGPFEVFSREALDSEVDSMFQIKVAGLNVLNVVDSWIDPATLPELARDAPWDMVLWPFQTMREIEVLSPSKATVAPPELPADWIDQLRILNPRYVVPSSCQFLQEAWSWYNHAFFPIEKTRGRQ
jgi:hypothetical protein